MALGSLTARRNVISLTTIALTHSWEAVLLPFSGFPAEEKEIQPAREFLHRFTAAAARTLQLSTEVFLQLGNLRNASKHFAQYGSAWQPELGLGVWPDREPPTLWTKADFEDLDVGDWPKPLMYKVMRIGAKAGRDSATNVMLGTGAVLQVMIPVETDAFLSKAKKLLLPGITEHSLRIFPFYIPLFEVKSVTSVKPEELEHRFCGASIYIRESREDKGLLIVSAAPLGNVLEEIGANRTPESPPRWELPI